MRIAAHPPNKKGALMPNSNKGGARGRGPGRTRTYTVAPVATETVDAGRPCRRPPDRLLAQTRLELSRMRDKFESMRRFGG